MTATAAADSTFKGWSGACKGTANTCTVTLKEAQNVIARTALLPITLNISKTGSGTDTVTSSPAGIDCGATCSATFTQKKAAHHDDSGKGGEQDNEHDEDHASSGKPTTVVTLTATPATDSTFEGWTGACTGKTATCIVTLDQAQNVSADFAPTLGITIRYPL